MQLRQPSRSAFRLNVSATVEPDADGDGYGDVTQDTCPSRATSQGDCQPPNTGFGKAQEADHDRRRAGPREDPADRHRARDVHLLRGRPQAQGLHQPLPAPVGTGPALRLRDLDRCGREHRRHGGHAAAARSSAGAERQFRPAASLAARLDDDRSTRRSPWARPDASAAVARRRRPTTASAPTPEPSRAQASGAGGRRFRRPHQHHQDDRTGQQVAARPATPSTGTMPSSAAEDRRRSRLPSTVALATRNGVRASPVPRRDAPMGSELGAPTAISRHLDERGRTGLRRR